MVYTCQCQWLIFGLLSRDIVGTQRIFRFRRDWVAGVQSPSRESYLGDPCSEGDCVVPNSACTASDNTWWNKQKFCICAPGFHPSTGYCDKNKEAVVGPEAPKVVETAAPSSKADYRGNYSLPNSPQSTTPPKRKPKVLVADGMPRPTSINRRPLPSHSEDVSATPIRIPVLSNRTQHLIKKVVELVKVAHKAGLNTGTNQMAVTDCSCNCSSFVNTFVCSTPYSANITKNVVGQKEVVQAEIADRFSSSLSTFLQSSSAATTSTIPAVTTAIWKTSTTTSSWNTRISSATPVVTTPTPTTSTSSSLTAAESATTDTESLSSAELETMIQQIAESFMRKYMREKQAQVSLRAMTSNFSHSSHTTPRYQSGTSQKPTTPTPATRKPHMIFLSPLSQSTTPRPIPRILFPR